MPTAHLHTFILTVQYVPAFASHRRPESFSLQQILKIPDNRIKVWFELFYWIRLVLDHFVPCMKNALQELPASWA